MTPLTKIPTSALLLRIALILDVPVQNVYVETINPQYVLGFYDYDARTINFSITIEMYYK